MDVWSCCINLTEKADKSVTPLPLLDKVGEEERGVADDASSPRLLMLTALQDKPVVHVALRMQAGLNQDRFHHYNQTLVQQISSVTTRMS